MRTKLLIAMFVLAQWCQAPASADVGWDAFGPLPRRWQGMAYDEARGVMVMFGGTQLFFYNSANATLNDTWEYNGEPDSVWEQRTIAGPSARYGHGMVYDSVRNVVVLFGGVAAQVSGPHAYSNETWEYDGKSWTLRPVSGPSPRWGFAFAFDSERGVTVLHGGTGANGYSGETWEYNGEIWTLRTTVGPPARSWHAMAFDTARNVCVMYGGATAPGVFTSETWEYDGITGTWLHQNVPGAGVSIGHALVFDPVNNVTLRWGGTPFSWFHTWDGTSWTPLTVDGVVVNGYVSHRYGLNCAYDNHRKSIIMFGGYDDNTSVWSDTWELFKTSEGWKATERIPSPHGGGLMYYDSVRHLLVLYRTDAMWEWNVQTRRWTKRPAPGTGPRSDTSIAYDSYRNVAVLFGGFRSQVGLLGDTWEWDPRDGTWTLKATTGPSPRRAHAMAFDEARGVTVLFGGSPAGQSGSDDTWEWDGKSWTQRMISGPLPRAGRGMVYDSHRKVTVLVGGTSGYTTYNDTWEYDGTEWTLRTNNSVSPARYAFAIAYDRVNHQTILFGGWAPSVTYGYVNDVWTWNGTSWTLRAFANSPEPRASYMIYDIDQQNAVIVGGGGWGITLRDHLLLRLPGTCLGDVAPPYRDGHVNNLDLLAVIQNWGASSSVSDVNEDGVVNVADLLLVIHAWGSCD